MTERNMESMLFDYQTTHKTDYKEVKIAAKIPVVAKHRAPKPRAPYKPLKDTHSIADWKDRGVAFSLMHGPKDVVRMNPYAPFKVQGFHKPPDEGKEHAQATRPRLVMTPAVGLDDIKDIHAREILMKDMYLSTAHAAMEEAVHLVRLRTKMVNAPLPGPPARAKPINLPCLRELVVPLEWRWETMEWDRRQLRSHCDTHREFWKPFHLYKDCVSCKEFAQVTRMRKLM